MKRYKKRNNHTIINQMNVVPYIDVMLVLLIIFMVTAPMFVPSVINLPKVGKAMKITQNPIQVSIVKDKHLKYNINQEQYNITVFSLDELTKTSLKLLQSQTTNSSTPIVISADKDIPYNDVIQVIDKLYSHGITKVSLVVKQ